MIQYQCQNISDYFHKLLSLESSNISFSTYSGPHLTCYIFTYLTKLFSKSPIGSSNFILQYNPSPKLDCSQISSNYPLNLLSNSHLSPIFIFYAIYYSYLLIYSLLFIHSS